MGASTGSIPEFANDQGASGCGQRINVGGGQEAILVLVPGRRVDVQRRNDVGVGDLDTVRSWILNIFDFLYHSIPVDLSVE